MYNILKLNEISPVISSHLPKTKYVVDKECASPDAILVRSADMHSMELGDNLLAVARAGAGVNNVPVEKCAEQGIVAFNTPGANANSVKELLLGAMIVMSRNMIDGVKWADTLKGNGDAVAKMVEKGKNQFVGPELKGKTLGVIGLGAIGNLVANDAHALGMNVLGYDPYISVESAWKLSRAVRRCTSLDLLFSECDFITIHVPLLDSTKGFLNKETFAKMKKGVRILNFARAELVNIPDMIEAVESGRVAGYATDFPKDELIGVKNIITIPHLGASTPEAEDNCAIMAARQLADYLEYGIIKNSVNYPDCDLPYTNRFRLAICHKNVANIIGQITKAVADEGINISDMINKSRGAYAYSIIDLDETPSEEALKHMASIDGIIRFRGIPSKD